MDKDEVRCPECGQSFPGEGILKWHRDSVHSPSNQNRGVENIATESIPPKPLRLFNREIKPVPAEIDTPTVKLTQVILSFVLMVGGGFLGFFGIRWVWSLGLKSFYGPLMMTLSLGYLELWLIRRFYSVITKPIGKTTKDDGRG